MMNGFRVLVAAFVLLCSVPAFADEAKITTWHSQNVVWDVDYAAGTLAIGTRTGLLVLRDGALRHFTQGDGLPYDEVLSVTVRDADTLYIGPFGPLDGPQRLYEARIREDDMSLIDITPAPPFQGMVNIIDIAPDGTLWVVDQLGFRRFDGGSWELVEFEEPTSFVMDGSIAFGADGIVWATNQRQTTNLAFCDGSNVSGEMAASVVGSDQDGTVFCATFQGLHQLVTPGQWDLLSDDEIWTVLWWEKFVFDANGELWAIGPTSLAHFNGSSTQVFDEIDDVWLGARTTRYIPFHRFLSSGVFICPDTMMLGTFGYGLMQLKQGRLTLTNIEDSLSGDWVIDLLEDETGGVWARNTHTSILGVFDNERWRQIDAPWLPMFERRLRGHAMGTGLDGSVWAPTKSGVVQFTNDETHFHDQSSSMMDGPAQASAIDANGVAWFTVSTTEAGAAVSFDGETWRRFSSTDYFKSDIPIEVKIGPNDTKWFSRAEDGYTVNGYTVFDGREWTHLDAGAELPDAGAVYFDFSGNAYISGARLYKGSVGGNWDSIYEKETRDLVCDTDGILWCASEEGILKYDNGEWSIEPWSAAVCEARDYLYPPSYANGSCYRLLIDYNGAKWAGTDDGLSRIEDGGAAQQRIELSSREEGDDVVLSAIFVNAGNPIALDAFLAVEIDGHLFYYPGWSAQPTPIRVVLPAYSTNTYDPLRLDRASLGDASYTFYACLSLIGNSSLMVGARDRKIACATMPSGEGRGGVTRGLSLWPVRR